MKWNPATILTLLALLITPSHAQIIPDSSLPINSQINPEPNQLTITGGTPIGTNLFHSFTDFNINPGNAAYFTPATGIETIISRVTGTNPSQILGTLGVVGNADLFFLNPNGILFSPTTQLNLNGSFIASTANRLLFADGTELNTLPNSPQLTISTPIGLGLINPGTIQITGDGHQLNALNFKPISDNSIGGLTVKPGKTLALIGGEINLDGAILTARDGTIHLAAVNQGEVKFSDGQLTIPNSSQLHPITLSQRSAINASGISGGQIQLWGNQINFTDGSVAFIQTLGIPPTETEPGTITIHATDQLTISGTDPIAEIIGSIRTETLGEIPGSSISIFTPNLTLIQGGGLFTSTYSTAPAGDLTLTIPNTLNIIGNSPRSVLAVSTITSATFGQGAAGDITINANQSTLQSGGLILSITVANGEGGTINLNTQNLELIGINPENRSPSAISSSSSGTGNAAQVQIQTERLRLENGGRIDSSTIAQGNAGRISINATDSITLKSPQSPLPSSIVSSADILNPLLRESFNVSDDLDLSGESGTITITSPQITIDESSEIRVTNLGTGDGGSLIISGELIELNQGSITAETQSGTGGNINLTADTLLLHESQISATAQNAGDGGNISVNTDNLVLLDSQIVANAFTGTGGNIALTSQGLFINPNSQLSASSEFGIDGKVELVINQPTIGEEIIEFPPSVESEVNLSQSCIQMTPSTIRLTRSGRRSLPISPGIGLSEWAIPTPAPTPAPPIREANAIVKLADGQIVLGYVPPMTYHTLQELVC
ncbi:two-partner secretion domain-containing protein [Coleofasciculus sp. E1-EBD-02]|uniref:two-partner secretion domain-containing protein n=1 Tax=Coleofasciculus sp. E1-EBD-02 TaxID=3068481 RepID=UPI0032F90714